MKKKISKEESKTKILLRDIKKNSSFVFLSSLVAVLSILTVKLYFDKSPSQSAFYILHVLHIFIFSLIVSALFFMHRKKPLLSIIIAVFTPIIIATLNDIILPYIGGFIFGMDIELHIPLFRATFIIISTAIIGALIGIETKFEKIPLFIQMLLSVFAALFYIMAFSGGFEILELFYVLIIVFIASLIGWCIRDIVLPMVFAKKDQFL